jgi:hypothetical protein
MDPQERLTTARDDAKRLHPCLVPFDDLPIGEQEYDRSIATETLKYLLMLGFRISKG